jgi:hypothetical protein
MSGESSLRSWDVEFDRIICSYDLDLDQRLSEETTVLVESYTVSGLCKPTVIH